MTPQEKQAWAATMIRRHNQTVMDLQRQIAKAQGRIDNLETAIRVLRRIVEGK
jgi:hypothetical protein